MPLRIGLTADIPGRPVRPRLRPRFVPDVTPTPTPYLDAIKQALASSPTPTPIATPRSYAPLTDAQLGASAGRLVRSQVDPILASISSAIDRRAQAGQAAITGLTQTLASRLGSYGDAARTAYGAAQASSAAANSALADRLSGAGSASADALASRLASINAPGATGEAVQALRQAGTGSGNALFGIGNASLQELIGNSAAAQDYAAKLPGIASLFGIQNARGFQQQLGLEQADKLGALGAQVPGLTAQVLSNLQAREQSKAGARTQIAQFNATGARSAAQAKAELAGRLLGALARLGGSRSTAAQGAPKISPGVSRLFDYATDASGNPLRDAKGRPIRLYHAPQEPQSAPKISSSVSRLFDYATDASGNPILDASGQPIPVFHPPKEPKAPRAPKAVGDRDKLLEGLGKDAFSFVSSLRKPQKVQEPIILRNRNDGTIVYRGKNGSPTLNRAEAATETIAKASPITQAAALRRVRQRFAPEIKVLAQRYGVKPAEIGALFLAQLEAAGYLPAAQKPRPTAAARATTPVPPVYTPFGPFPAP